MNEVEVITVMNYIDDQLFEPKINWPREEFSRRSYSRWAAYEILELVLNRPFNSATELIEDFIIEMWYFLYIAPNEKSGYKFLIAMDVAENILLLM